jgi:ABC-type phosphate transport system permease subunit
LGSLPTYIFAMFMYGSEFSVARAWSGSVVLLSIVLFFFVLARRLGGRSEKRANAGVGKAARTSVGTK